MDWQERTMNHLRELMKQADPEIIEEQKYKKASNPGGIPVWYRNGMICTGETYKQHIRLTFSKGKDLKEYDPTGIINNYRAAVIKEHDTLDDQAFIELIRAAVKLNQQGK